MHLLRAISSCFRSKPWPTQLSAKTLAVLKILDDTKARDLQSSFFLLLLQRIKVISSRELCECSLDLLVQLGLAAGGAETIKAMELSWSSLQSSVERADTFKIELADIVDDRDSLLPIRNIFDALPFDVQDVPWLIGASKRPLACSIIIRHFARLSMIQSADVWKSSTNFHVVFACTDRLFRTDNAEDDIAIFEALVLACVFSADHCRKSLPKVEQQLLLDVISLLGTLGRLFAKKVDMRPQPSESLLLRAIEAVLLSSIAVLEHSSRSKVTGRQTLLEHVAFEIVGTYSALLESCNYKQGSRRPRIRIKKIEQARGRALTVISDCAAATGLLPPDLASARRPVRPEGIDSPQMIDDSIPMSHRDGDDMSIAASFVANWGEGIDPESSDQSLVLETPTVVFQTM
jgi:hypothetical protein